MAMQYGFFNAVENSGAYDRECDAAFFTALLAAVTRSATLPGSFPVSVGSGLTVNVGSGKGFIDGVFFYDENTTTLTCTSATGTRTDLVVAKLNAAARTVTLEIKTGTNTPASGEIAIAKLTVTGSSVTAVQNVAAVDYGAVCGNAERVGGHRIYVQQSQPSSPQVGDLWLW